VCARAREDVHARAARRDPFLVRSHFKHLLYHDRPLGSESSMPSVSCSRSLELGEKTLARRNETWTAPLTRIKDPFARWTSRLRSHPLRYARRRGITSIPNLLSEIRRIVRGISHAPKSLGDRPFHLADLSTESDRES